MLRRVHARARARERGTRQRWLVAREKKKKKKRAITGTLGRELFLFCWPTPASRRNRRGILMNEQYREWMPFVVVIPIVWEPCVWLRPVGVVSIARPYSRTIQQNESPVCVGVFLSYPVFSRSLFSDARSGYVLASTAAPKRSLADLLATFYRFIRLPPPSVSWRAPNHTRLVADFEFRRLRVTGMRETAMKPRTNRGILARRANACLLATDAVHGESRV